MRIMQFFSHRMDIIKFSVMGLLFVALFITRFILVKPETAGPIVVATAYFTLALNFLIFLALLLNRLKNIKLTNGILIALASSLIGTLFIHTTEEHRFKVVNDEYALLNVSMSMHLYKKAGYATNAQRLEGEMYHQDFVCGKRSLFFQFLTSLIHGIRGYSPYNGFVLNVIITFILFLLLNRLIYSATDSHLLSLSGMLLVASLPLVSFTATSSGYDLLNAVLIICYIITGAAYLRSASIQDMNLFLATSLLLAQTRSESILFMLGFALAAILVWLRNSELSLTWLSTLSPLFLLHTLLLNAHMFSSADNLGFKTDNHLESFLSFQYLITNLMDALNFFFNPYSSHLNATLTGILGLIGMGGLLLMKKSQKSNDRPDQFTKIIWISVVLSGCCFLVMVSHFWGQLTDPLASRFALPQYILAILLFIIFASRFTPLSIRKNWILGVAMVVFAQSAFTRITTDETELLNGASKLYHWILEQAGTREGNNAFIYDSVLGLIAFEHSVIRLEVANSRPEVIQVILSESTFENLYSFSLWKKEANDVVHKPLKGKGILRRDLYNVELVERIPYRNGFEGRMYRITGVKSRLP